MLHNMFKCCWRSIYCFVAVIIMVILAVPASAQTPDTNCTPRALPWGTSFEENEADLGCWTVMYASSQQPYISANIPTATGSHALIVAARGNDESCLLAMPRMAYRADSLLVGFELTQTAGAGVLQAGLVSDTTDTSTFIPLLTIDLTTAVTGYYEFYTTPACGTDSLWVAFRVAEGLVYIDDVEVSVASNCRRPRMPWIGNVYITEANVGWSSSGGTASAYLVRRINLTTGDTVYVPSYSTSCTLYDLTAGTSYDVAVAALCGSDTTRWLPIGTIVTDVACRTPLDASVAALTAQAAGLSWTYDTLGINHPTAMRVSVYDVTTSGVPHGAPTVVTASHAFVDNLTTGHHYQAVLQTICSIDTSAPVVLTFTPLAEACTQRSGNGVNSSLPLTAQSAYSYAQMLYPKSLLNGIDSLFAVAVRVEHSSAYAPRRVDLYVGQTTDTLLTYNISTVTSVKVAENVLIDNLSTGWINILFNAPLEVDTSRNLLITVVDNTGYPSGSMLFGSHQEAYGGSLYGSSLTQAFDPTVFDMPLTPSALVADLRLFGNCAMSACQPPAAMVTAVTTSSITLQWAGSGSKVVRYRAVGMPQWQVVNATGSSYTIGSLNAATRYELQVGTQCGYDTAYCAIIETMTDCETVTVPYLTSFVSGTHPCWQGQQRWQTGGLLIVGNLVSPEVNAIPNTLQVRMLLRSSGAEGHLYVGVGDADGSTVTWMDTIVVDFSTFAERTAYLLGYNGPNRHIVLASDAGVILQWVSIEPLDDCLPPRHIVVVSVSDNSAALSWQGVEGQSYSVYLREAGGTQWASWQATTCQLTISGLQPNTNYEGYAVSHCSGAAAVSSQAWFLFGTTCGVIRYLPFNESFEGADALRCWRLDYADAACGAANPITISDGLSHSGGHAIRFSSYNYVESEVYNQYVISPRIVADDSITVGFYYTKTTIASEPFSFGISVESDNLEDFMWFSTVEPVAGRWEHFEKRLPSAVRYVAIQYIGQENFYLYIDDFSVTGAGCNAPTITSVDEQLDHVRVDWLAAGDSARVAITDGLWLDAVEGTAVAGNSYTFSGLQPGQYYTVGVRNICPDGHLSAWTTRRVSTIDTGCTAPAALTLDNISYTTAAVSWTPQGGEQQWQLCLMADGELLWLSQMLTATSYIIENLENNRNYSLLVRALCTDIPGPWSDTLHIQTTECLPVGEASYERVNFRTVTISWQDAPITTSRCRIEYGEQGFMRGTGQVVEANTNPYTIDGLEPEPNYDFYLQNYCEPGVLSDSAVYLTIPTGLGIDEIGERCPVVTIHPNPAATDVTVSVDQPAVVSVMDISGRTVVQPTHINSTFRIPHSSLLPGAYFVRVVNTSGSTTLKLIVR